MPKKRRIERNFLDVFGSFPVPRSEGRISRPGAAWWRDEVDAWWPDVSPGVSSAIGCYMFCLEDGGTIKPWYIGMTVNRKGFRDEVFTDHKLGIYNRCLAQRRGRPSLFLFPLVINADDEGYRFSRASSSAAPTIAWLEKALMGLAYAQNPAIRNVKDMTRLRTVTLRGIMGTPRTGRPHADVALARRALLGR